MRSNTDQIGRHEFAGDVLPVATSSLDEHRFFALPKATTGFASIYFLWHSFEQRYQSSSDLTIKA